MDGPHIEQATLDDLPQLTELVAELFSMEGDFVPDPIRQSRGIRMILEQPSRGRIFTFKQNGVLLGMINLLFTISTAEGAQERLQTHHLAHRPHECRRATLLQKARLL